MEWFVLVVFSSAAALLIGLPLWREQPAALITASTIALQEQREALLLELSELDEDLASGRISTDERLAARRTLAPRLRTVTEQLRASGDNLTSEQ